MKKQITVLVADDSQLFRKSLTILISETIDLRVAGEASNGEEAISMAKDLRPDIILMDINMAPVNGFEATRKILKHNPAAKIIGLSVHSEATYAENLLKLGAKGYVTKDALYQEISDAIATVFNGGKYIAKDLDGQI